MSAVRLKPSTKFAGYWWLCDTVETTTNQKGETVLQRRLFKTEKAARDVATNEGKQILTTPVPTQAPKAKKGEK